MTDLPVPLPADRIGPAFDALTPWRRAFVAAYCTNGCKGAEAVRSAGTAAQDPDSPKQQAWRTLQRPDVRAAIRELTLAGIQTDLPKYRDALIDIASNSQHKDQVKALLALMNRGGLNEIVEKNINVNVRTEADKLARIRDLAEKHGIPISTVLGTVTDAEFTELPAPKTPEQEWMESDKDF